MIDIKSFMTTKNYVLHSNVELLKLIIIDNFVERKKNANKLMTKLKNLRKFFRAKIK